MLRKQVWNVTGLYGVGFEAELRKIPTPFRTGELGKAKEIESDSTMEDLDYFLVRDPRAGRDESISVPISALRELLRLYEQE
jgi:hypothetical protein